MFKIFTSEFGVMSMHMLAVLDMVTEGVVHGVYKVVTHSSFGVTQRHEASVVKWEFCH